MALALGCGAWPDGGGPAGVWAIEALGNLEPPAGLPLGSLAGPGGPRR